MKVENNNYTARFKLMNDKTFLCCVFDKKEFRLTSVKSFDSFEELEKFLKKYQLTD